MKKENLLKYKVLNILTNSIKKYLESENQIELFPDLKIRIEYSRDEKFGDYSSSFALENKNSLGKSPQVIAEKIISLITTDSFIESVTFSQPGFINFRISPLSLTKYASEFRLGSDPFAKEEKTKKVLLEFVSANPTGPMNIVSARSAAYGDALANLISTLGHTVKREFYVNDYGNQVYLLGVAVLLRYKELNGETISFQEEESDAPVFQLVESNILPKESYRGEYIKDIAKRYSSDGSKKSSLDMKIKNKDWDSIIRELSLFAINYNLEGQKKDLDLFGVKFDEFFSERSLHDAGEVEKVPARLKESDKKTEEGKLFFLSTNYGDDKDRVILREDGRPTYLMADIAYHKNKYDRGFEEIIDIWGPDHYGYIARLKGAIQSLGFGADSFRVLIAQQVNLIENKEKVKMSKRLGVFQTMTDLLSYLGKSARDVGRYFFLMRSSDAPLDFDLDLAKDESEKNPVFYIQYAYARICSIFRELGEVSGDPVFSDTDLEFLKSDERARLLFWTARFPEEVNDAAVSFEPHRLTNYLQSLSRSFTKFYSGKDNRIKEKSGREREILLQVCKSVQFNLREGLQLLGISAPERMSKEESK
ncbi:arginine--tRNA ligase [Leptospira kobayashii]|nr:arginine--tRNA ligase [Leptospira kobayashii]